MIRAKFSIFKTFLLVPVSMFILLSSCVDSEISKSVSSSGSSGSSSSTKTISGTAVDILTGDALSDTWLCLEDGTTCTQTDSDGNYTFNDVSYGTHTITPRDANGGSVLQNSSGNDYEGYTFTIDENSESIGFDMLTGDTSKMSDSIVITITWETSDDTGKIDIDSHLIIPLGGDCNGFNTSDNRYFTDASSNPYTKLDYKSKMEGAAPFAIDSTPFSTLDLDDLGKVSDGPGHRETVVLKLKGNGSTKCTGTYKFYLNNFSSGSTATNGNFPSTKVKIVKDGENFAEYDSADTGGNKYWGVFSVASDGSISVLSQYNDDCETLFSEMSGTGKCADATQ